MFRKYSKILKVYSNRPRHSPGCPLLRVEESQIALHTAAAPLSVWKLAHSGTLNTCPTGLPMAITNIKMISVKNSKGTEP